MIINEETLTSVLDVSVQCTHVNASYDSEVN